MNLVTNKKILLIAVAIAFVLVVVFVIGSTVIKNRGTTTTTSSSSSVTSKLASSNLSEGPTTNSAVVDLNLTDPTIKLPTVTLSSDPLLANGSLSSLVSSAVVSSVVSSAVSSQSDDPKAPTNMYVTNKDYKIWSVVWTTKTPTIGKLKYGTSASSLDKVLSDDRPSLNGKTSYSHQVTITVSDTVLNAGNPTFYYKIFSDDTEYGNGTSPYTYANAPLLSSPSSPVNAVINLSKSITSNDAVILARIKTGSENSEWVSSVLSGTNAILNIGTARKADLKSYMPPSSPNKLEVSVLGPNGKVIGTKTDISLANIEDAVITVTVTPTTISVTSSSTLSSVVSTIRSSSRSSIIAVATSSVSSSISSSETTIPEESTSSIGTVPKTAIEDDLSLLGILIVSLIILIAGTSSLYKINTKQNFGRRVLEGDD